MRASRAAELHDSNPWAHLALGWVKRHTDDAVVEYVGGSKVRPSWLSGWPSTGSRTEAYKVVWTGRCDWDCDSVLARIARLGLLYGHPRGAMGSSLTEGSRKNSTGGPRVYLIYQP